MLLTTTVLELIGEAETAATRLGTARVLRSPFSPTNVAIYQIGGLREFAIRCGAVC
jgi:hypothetical protein